MINIPAWLPDAKAMFSKGTKRNHTAATSSDWLPPTCLDKLYFFAKWWRVFQIDKVQSTETFPMR